MPELSNADPRLMGLKFLKPAAGLGFLASAWQVLFLREFSAQFYGSELAFGFVLASWLLWGGLGGWVGNRHPFRRLAGPDCLRLAILGAPIAFAALRFSRFLLGILPGEVTGLESILGFALGPAFFLNFPLGLAFSRITEAAGGDAARTYLWESAGATAGALAVYGALLPRLSNWEALAAVEILAAISLARRGRGPVRIFATAAALIVGAGLAVFDTSSQAIHWRPLQLESSRDGLYGRIQIVRRGDQITIYENGLRAFSSSDPAAAEEAAAFPLLQRRRAERVLLIGGTIGGTLREILRLPVGRVDAVEIDPAIIAAARPFLPSEDRLAFDDPRVRLIAADGRAFLRRSRNAYDAVILGLSDPATAQINRFFTAEFFALVKQRLAPGGVMSFRASAAENYISPVLARYLGTLAATLRSFFDRVEIVPGATVVFLASDGPLTIDPEALAREIDNRGLTFTTLTSSSLRARLHPLRQSRLQTVLEGTSAVLNHDARPISFFFQTMLWSAQKHGAAPRILGFLSRFPPTGLLAAAVLIPLLALAASLLRSRKRPNSFSILPFTILGLTTMATEILLLIRFQTIHGGLYGRVALLLGLFMAGMTAGSWRGARRTILRRSSVLIPPTAFFILLLGSTLGWDRNAGTPVFACLFFLWGFLSGNFFVSLTRAQSAAPAEAGRGYAADLLGSFVGSVFLTSVLLPLAGIDSLFAALAFVSLGLVVYLFLDKHIRLPGHV